MYLGDSKVCLGEKPFGDGIVKQKLVGLVKGISGGPAEARMVRNASRLPPQPSNHHRSASSIAYSVRYSSSSIMSNQLVVHHRCAGGGGDCGCDGWGRGRAFGAAAAAAVASRGPSLPTPHPPASCQPIADSRTPPLRVCASLWGVCGMSRCPENLGTS